MLCMGIFLGWVLKTDPGVSPSFPEYENKIDSLQSVLDSLRSEKIEKIDSVMNLGKVESKKYLVEKVKETTGNDSLDFSFDKDSTHVLIDTASVKVINGLLEEREILKCEVALLDSLSQIKDTLIQEQKIVIQEQAQEIKKEKRKTKLWKGTSGALAIIATVLAIML